MATGQVFKSCFVCFPFNNKIHFDSLWKKVLKCLLIVRFESLAYDYYSQVYNLFTLYKANFLGSVVVLAY